MMMLKNVLFFMLCVVLAFSGCVGFFCSDGSGRIISEDRQVGSFESVSMELAGNLYLAQDGKDEITVEVDDNLMDSIDSVVEGNVLRVKLKDARCLNPTERVKVYVSMTDVSSITLNGQGDIISESVITSEDLELNLNGDGDVYMQLNASHLTAVISGRGDIVFDGYAKNQDLIINGQGNIDSSGLISKNTAITINGLGNAKVHASDSLDVEINGVGEIYYWGEPANITQSMSGSGRLIRET